MGVVTKGSGRGSAKLSGDAAEERALQHLLAQGLTLVQQSLEQADERTDFYEVSVGSDSAAVAMRRWLKTLADREAAAA